jgi:hypothetical protein
VQRHDLENQHRETEHAGKGERKPRSSDRGDCGYEDHDIEKPDQRPAVCGLAHDCNTDEESEERQQQEQAAAVEHSGQAPVRNRRRAGIVLRSGPLVTNH